VLPRLVAAVTFIGLLLAAPAGAQVYHWGSFGGELFPAPVVIAGLEEAVKIDAGNASGFALEPDGTVVAVGNNGHGQLGDGTTEYSETPVRVSFPTGVRIVAIGEAEASGYAIDSTGQGWAWGKATNELCLGKIDESVLEPEKVPGITHALAVQGGGQHVLWLMEDGTVEACGANGEGQLGIGANPVTSASARTIKSLSGVVEISAGEQSSCARTASGSVYDWGSDEHGQVGNGLEQEAVDEPFHVPLPGAASEISCGGSLPSNGHTLALVKGIAYGWGDDASGQLGDGKTVNKLSPAEAVEVASLGLTQVVASGESSIGLAADGNVEAWGSNASDALGQGKSKPKRSLSPMLVGAGAVEISGTAADGEYRT
jgi:alpha-tubulin suppressor-like RCC1 family protein